MAQLNELEDKILATAKLKLAESISQLFNMTIKETRRLAPELTKDLSNDELQHLIVCLISYGKLKLKKFYGFE